MWGANASHFPKNVVSRPANARWSHRVFESGDEGVV